jgi:tRNA G18 (ribose-2'-O)-methylase SpoU
LPEYIEIADPEDPRIAAYRNVRDRDLARGHGGLFVAEGESVVKVLLGGSRLAPASVLVADNRRGTIDGLVRGHDLPVYVARQAVLDAIVGFPIHRGLLALGRRGAALDAGDLLADGPGLVVGLAGIANHDNVGGIFRNAAAFGAGAVLMDPATCDPLYRKALRVSVGGVLRVPFATVPSAEAMAEMLAGAGYLVLGLSPRGNIRLDEVPKGGRTALILGTEGPGLADPVMARTTTVRIDMAGGFDSLNVATTSGIALYELTRR